MKMKVGIVKNGRKFWLVELCYLKPDGSLMSAAEVVEMYPLDCLAAGTKRDLVALCKREGWDLV